MAARAEVKLSDRGNNVNVRLADLPRLQVSELTDVAVKGERVYSWPQADWVGFGCMGEWIWEVYFFKYGLRGQMWPLRL